MLAACGSYADGDQGSLESVVAEEISQQIEREAPMVEVRSVECLRKDAATDCAVQLGVGNIVLSLHYDVVLGDDRCWVATARDLRVDGVWRWFAMVLQSAQLELLDLSFIYVL